MPRRAAHHRIAVAARARDGERVARLRLAIDDEAGVARKMAAPVRTEAFARLEEIIRPRACGVQHQLGANIELLAVDPIAHPRAAHAALVPEKSRRLGVIGGDGSAAHGGLDEGEHEARRVVHLPVLEYRAAGEGALLELGKEIEGFGAGEELRAGDAARFIGDARISAQREQVVDVHPGGQECLALTAVSVGRNQDRQRGDQMRGDAQHRGALGTRGAQPPDIGVLQIADAAMDHLEALGRGAAREIPLLDQRDPQAAQRRVPRRGGAERPAADDEHVELRARECLEMALHVAGSSAPKIDLKARSATKAEPASDK